MNDLSTRITKRYPIVKGVSVPRCVSGRRLWTGHRAHAHTVGTYAGWICAWKPETLWDGGVTNTLKHEVAHLRAPQRIHGGHGQKWIKMARRMGVTGLERYEAKYEPVAAEREE